MNSRILIGVVLLIAAAGIIVGAQVLTEEDPEPPEVITIHGYLGGEKRSYMSNPEVQSLLRDRYNIEVSFNTPGSIEMVEYPASDYEGIDFVWPSNSAAATLFQERNNLGSIDVVDDATIFRSPIVLYSWTEIVDALQVEGIVELRDQTYYVVDMNRLINLLVEATPWSDVGVELRGNMRVISTDPIESNSGNMFYALLMNLLAPGDIVTADTFDQVMPTVLEYYARQGYQEGSSGDMFEEYVFNGVGANPIVVGYENQLVEYYLNNPTRRDALREQTRMMYPEPTVLAEHPLMALTENGRILLNALQNDEDLQRIAWEQHGFRAELVVIDTSTLEYQGLPNQVRDVVNLPRPEIINDMLDELRATTQ